METTNINPNTLLIPHEEAEKIIKNSHNIYIINKESQEAQCVAMALFYILKEYKKNANLVSNEIPENLKFLAPSLDFISYPKNFVISIPRKSVQISNIYHEANNESIKIHMTLENGKIKKEDVSFYFSEQKPDLIVTIGIQDYSKELEEKLNTFGFLLGAQILNIDNNENENEKFGNINLLEKKSLAELILNLSFQNINKKAAEGLLASLIIYTNGFKQNITAEIFEMAGSLMKKGADIQELNKNLNIV